MNRHPMSEKMLTWYVEISGDSFIERRVIFLKYVHREHINVLDGDNTKADHQGSRANQTNSV